MVTVIASISLKPGCMQDFLRVFKANVPQVRAEAGCIEYYPTSDVPADLPPQKLEENVVTVIEKWESVEALHEHFKAPHMASYRENVKDMVQGVSLKVLQEA